MFRCGHADADGTGQHAFAENAENPGIRQIVKTIGNPVVRIRLDCTLMEVSAVPQTINRVLFDFRFRQTIFDLFSSSMPRSKGRLLSLIW
jgi:hypothetical protein